MLRGAGSHKKWSLSCNSPHCRFGSPANSEALDAILERETVATTLTDHSFPYPSSRGTPQLPNGTRYIGYNPPGYINPPPFEEAMRSRSGSRSSRPQSSASHTEKPPAEWNDSRNSRHGFVGTSYEDPFEKKEKRFGGEDSGPESSYSVQTYSDGDSEVTDATEYSHLAGAGQYPRTYHHLKVQTQECATLVWLALCVCVRNACHPGSSFATIVSIIIVLIMTVFLFWC